MKALMLIIFTALVLCPPASAQRIYYLSHFAYPGWEALAQDTVTYLSGLGYVVAVNTANRYSPRLIGFIPQTTGSRELCLRDTLLYVLVNSGGLKVANVSNPAEPQIIGSFSDNTYSPTGMALSGDLIFYVAWSAPTFKIVDISDPTHPQLTATLELTGLIDDICVQGDYAYVSGGGDGLYILDISDPSRPGVIWHDYQLKAECAYVRGNYVYVCEDSLKVVNISDPAAPQVMGTCDLQGFPQAMDVQGEYAYISGWPTSLNILNIADPGNPVAVCSYGEAPNSFGVCVSDRLIYLVTQDDLKILRFDPLAGISDNTFQIPSDPLLTQNYPNPFNAQTTIKYILKNKAEISLSIYNITGRKVATLFEGMREAGDHQVVWNAEDISSGIYFAKLESGEKIQSIRMTLLK